MKHSKRIICLLLFTISVSLSAQEYGYKHYTVQDGLVQSQVISLFQDSKGYIWVGTKGGVSRFDGISFMNLTFNDGLFNGVVSHITEDHEGSIWFLTSQGISSYSGKVIKSFPTNIFRNCNAILDFYEKEPGKLVVVYANPKNQVIFTQFSDGKFTEIASFFSATDLEFPDNIIYEGIYDAQSKTFWLLSAPFGLYKVIDDKIEIINFKVRKTPSISKGLDNKLYFSTNDSIYTLEGDSVRFLFPYETGLDRNSNIRLAIDKNGTIFCNNEEQGLMIIDSGNVYKEHFKFNEIASLLVDRENNLWIGTEYGIYRQLSRSFVNYIPVKCGIKNLIWSISEDKYKRVWFASFCGGLQYLENGNFSKGEGYQHFIKSEDQRYYIGSIIDHEQNILFPTTHFGGLKFDGHTFSKIFPDSLERTTLFFFEDPDNFDLYAGTNNGLYRISKEKGWQNLGIQPGNGKSRIAVSIIKDKLHRFWFGGFNGLSIKSGDRVSHLPTKEFPFNEGGNVLLTDPRENVWIGNSKGLFHYNFTSFQKIGKQELNVFITSMALIGDSVLLIGSSNGLAMLDLNSWYNKGVVSLKVLDKIRGFEGIEVGQNAIFRDSKGLYWIATADRVVQFNPALYKSNSIPPATYISDISILNNKMEWIKVNDSLKNGGSYRFSNDQKNLRFDFIGISTTAPEGVRYSYFLEGYDEGWSIEVSERYAVYTNLPPGEYKLLLKSCNADGVWTPEATSIAFQIVPAIYQRTWFWVILILLSAGLFVMTGFAISLRRRKVEQLQLMNENKMARLQLLSLKNQMDPHFTFNAMNTIASFVLKEQKEQAYKFFVKLSQIIRTIIRNSDNLYCTIDMEINLVIDYLEIQKLRFNDQFTYSVIVSPETNLAQKVPKMVILTFVENALKHGLANKQGPGEITIDIQKAKENLNIAITDNGIGRERAKEIPSESTGKGIQILKGYIDYFNRFNQNKMEFVITDLYNEEKTAIGTTVLVTIPTAFIFEEPATDT